MLAWSLPSTGRTPSSFQSHAAEREPSYVLSRHTGGTPFPLPRQVLRAGGGSERAVNEEEILVSVLFPAGGSLLAWLVGGDKEVCIVVLPSRLLNGGQSLQERSQQTSKERQVLPNLISSFFSSFLQ